MYIKFGIVSYSCYNNSPGILTGLLQSCIPPIELASRRLLRGRGRGKSNLVAAEFNHHFGEVLDH